MTYREMKFREQYIMPICDQTLQMVSDTRIKAACTRTRCIFSVCNKMLTRKISSQSMRFCILEIRGGTQADIDRCNKQLENYFPAYKLRKKYDYKLVHTKVQYNEWTPDNTYLYYLSQRFGLGRNKIAEMDLNAPCGGEKTDVLPFPSTLMDMVAERPRSDWIIDKREIDGAYTTSFGNCLSFRNTIFRPAQKNRTYKGVMMPNSTTKPLPRMNYFQDPGYLDRLIDPTLAETERHREMMLEAERHSHKTVKGSLPKSASN
ncbi:hypothetical protein BOX15_Mlig029325g1 [Macrostomum lignano]|uniref:Uncharacterized protein n=1 Tax=Macrostomum lignano TaxID=282301 RepID=A0A267F8C8_9PLAT|nr:hypothetical protein BOX15_Mlig020883g1 [Macrostomum lignano]PAA90303.1 hypothetical protein BOX15_Mlig023048g1 [Macrostomum lignano]PAA92587.1 hypothetical protein BOX15_Mlig029325g1 [Macrostomum lignano]